jgi:hypothetical protein
MRNGYLDIQLMRLSSTGNRTWRYILFKLKKPLTPGVEFAFSMQMAKNFGGSNPAQSPAVDRIGAVLLHDLPANMESDGFLPGLTPFVESPPGIPVGTTRVTLQDTIIGNGEKYLLIGIFHPDDSLTFSPEPASAWSNYYLFDSFSLFRPWCGGATSDFQADLVTGCPGDTVTITPMHSTPPLQWTVNGVYAGSEASIQVVVPQGTDSLTIRLIGDVGACADTNYMHVTSRYVNMDLQDTALFCTDPMLIAPTLTYHNVNSNAVSTLWTSVDGTYSNGTFSNISTTLSDTGTYVVQLNHNNCVQLDTFRVAESTPLLLSDSTPYILPEVRPEHCVNMYDGAIIMHDLGYPSTVSYTWTNPPMPSVSDSAMGLTTGTYLVRVSDLEGRCEEWSTNIPLMLDSCAAILGTVSASVDHTCDTPDDDGPLAYETVSALPSGNMGVSGVDGQYAFFVPPGISTIHHDPTGIWTGNLCGDGTLIGLPSAGDQATQAILDTIHVPVRDLALVSCHPMGWVVANEGHLNLTVKNQGELPEQECTLKIHVGNPSILGIVAGDPDFVGYSGDTVMFDIGPLQPQQVRTKTVRWDIPLDTDLIGVQVPVHLSLSEAPDDSNLANNVMDFVWMVLGAYDPNDKQVMPPGLPGTDLTDPSLRRFTYTVRFQNTGNYPATRVLITDTISPLLAPTSLQVLHTSHNAHVFLYDGVLYMDHQGIMLPDSMSDPEGSNGYVVFAMDAVASANIGDEILNTAHIFFDQNPPITTNTVRNVYGVDITTSTLSQSPQHSGLRIDHVGNTAIQYHCLGPFNPSDLRVYDSVGNLVRNVPPKKSDLIRLDDLRSGTYLLVAIIAGDRHVARFAVAR